MKNSNFELSIVVNNKTIPEYFYKGDIFVEGRNKSKYAIRLKNNTANTVLFIPSVDGLNVLDGKECSNASPGYVLNAYGSLDVACYKIDDKTGAEFVFGNKERSYSQQIGKGTANVGVIAAVVYKDYNKQDSSDYYKNYTKYKPWVIYPNPYPYPYFYPYNPYNPYYGYTSLASGNLENGINNISCNADGGSFSSMTASSISQQSMNQSSITRSVNQSQQSDDVSFKMGTEFGDAMKWNTTSVSFIKATTEPCAKLMVYYDSRKNLEKRGIVFKSKVPELPNPFPGNSGCELPKNWKR